MKRFCIFFMAALLVCMTALTALPAAAQTETIASLVVLGDSISTGYGLEGSLHSRASYSNLVASSLGLSLGNGYINLAVDGFTSAQILQRAKDNEATVAAADMIMMTNGGNDVMWKMLDIAMKSVGVTSLDVTQLAIALMFSDPAAIEAKLYAEENLNTISAALITYRTNLTATLQYLRRINPDVRVLVLTQYNPASGMSAFGVLDTYVEGVIGQLNAVMTEVVTAEGYELVDAHAAMVGRGVELSNIKSGDIHPNAAGHAAIAEVVKTHLGIADAEDTETEMTTTLPAVTTAAPDETTPVPDETTAPAQTTTAIPEETTTEPAVTTTEPIVTTTEPVVTTTEPVVTTTEPLVTTTPAATTTAAPVQTEPSAPETETATQTTSATSAVAPDPAQPPTDDGQAAGDTDATGAPVAVIVGASLIGVGVIALLAALLLRKRP